MLVKAVDKDLPLVFSAIGERLYAALYLYTNLRRYGLDNPHINLWIDSATASGEILLVIMQYYSGVTLFSNSNTFEPAVAASLLHDLSPSIISGLSQTVDPLVSHFEAYRRTDGLIGEATMVTESDDTNISKAAPEDLRQVADLLASDAGFGAHTTSEKLFNELKERSDDGYGRSLVIKDADCVVAHAATYAELADIAVTSGVVTHPHYRRQGLMRRVYSLLINTLLSEGKRVFATYFTPAATALHHSLGFDDKGTWSKLEKPQ